MKFGHLLFCILPLMTSLYSEYTPNCSQEIDIQIKISCPKSEEYSAFVNTMPRHETDQVESYEEWRDSFVAQMLNLIELVQSGKVGNTSLSVTTHDTP